MEFGETPAGWDVDFCFGERDPEGWIYYDCKLVGPDNYRIGILAVKCANDNVNHGLELYKNDNEPPIYRHRVSEKEYTEGMRKGIFDQAYILAEQVNRGLVEWTQHWPQEPLQNFFDNHIFKRDKFLEKVLPEKWADKFIGNYRITPTLNTLTLRRNGQLIAVKDWNPEKFYKEG